MAGYPRQWIVAYQQTLFTFGSTYIQNTWKQRFCAGEHQMDHWTDCWKEWIKWFVDRTMARLDFHFVYYYCCIINHQVILPVIITLIAN